MSSGLFLQGLKKHQELFLEAVTLQNQLVLWDKAELRKEAFNVGEILLEMHCKRNFKWISRYHTHFDLFKIARKDPEMKLSALKHLKAGYELLSNICPYSKLAVEIKKLVDTLSCIILPLLIATINWKYSWNSSTWVRTEGLLRVKQMW